MQKAYIDPNNCDASPFCPVKRACPVLAVTQEKKGFLRAFVPIVQKDKCIGCRKCLDFCPHNAVRMKSY